MQALVEVVDRVLNEFHGVLARIEEDGAIGPVELGQPRMPLAALAHYQLGGLATGRKGFVRRFGKARNSANEGLLPVPQ